MPSPDEQPADQKPPEPAIESPSAFAKGSPEKTTEQPAE